MRHRATVCGHPCSSPHVARCGACWRARGSAPRKARIATVCGHPAVYPGAKYCRSCYDARRKAITDQRAPSGVPGDSFSAKGDDAEVSTVTPEHVRTLADLIRVCQIDTTEWIVERWVANKWEMGAKDDDGKIVTRPLFQVKAWLKRNVNLLAARAEVAQLIEDARRGLPKLGMLPKRGHTATSGTMLELNIADLHLGKLAWDAETGHGHYDSREAEAQHDRAVETLLARTSSYRFESILIVLGNDLLHIDGRANTTTAGTPQDSDSRYHKIFLATRRMVTRMIERCRSLAPVRVVLVPGNHDRDSVWHLGDSLACLYERTKDVVIDNAPTLRKYIEFGKVMLLVTHGDKAKHADYPLLMATEQPGMFGRTVYREAHTGHFHQTRVQEFHGVRVRILPALSGTDAWHAENGYVGNLRAAEAFVWSKEEGLLSTAYYTLNPERVRAARPA
jgi:hypothetical protein